MIEWVHPGLIFIIGALLIPFVRGEWKKAYLLLLPIAALIDLSMMSEGVFWRIPLLEYELVFGRVDTLSLIFGYIFAIAAFCMTLYALHVKEDGQHIAAFLYVGSTLGVVFAGDLFTLYLFWEVMAFSSLFLIWYRKTEASSEAGLRYIMVHIFGGVCLLAGIVLYVQETGSIAFPYPGAGFLWGLGSSYLASYFILTGFLVNAAALPLHAWLADAYPEATVTGTVFLSAFTTKSAIYVLLRGFPGVDILIWLGALTAIYGVVFAVMENDARRLLAYVLISQGGYMMAGVGMASKLAIDGAIAHASCCVLYMGLLFMGAGAVLEVTGRSKLTELGGLYRRMPATFWLYMVGALSVSGMPFFSGFVSKTLIVESAAGLPSPWVWLLLEGASLGAFLVAGLKLPYFTWFGRKEPAGDVYRPLPRNMPAAMGITASLCVLIGVYPQALYGMLPYPVEYHPYAVEHLISMWELLLFSFLGFILVTRMGLLRPVAKITLDTDWFYRIAGRRFIWFCERPLLDFADFIDKMVKGIASFLVWFSRNPTAASRIMLLTMGVVLTKPFNPVYMHYEADLAELRRLYPGEPVHRVAIGMGVLLVVMFFVLYLLIYLTYGVLWT